MGLTRDLDSVIRVLSELMKVAGEESPQSWIQMPNYLGLEFWFRGFSGLQSWAS